MQSSQQSSDPGVYDFYLRTDDTETTANATNSSEKQTKTAPKSAPKTGSGKTKTVRSFMSNKPTIKKTILTGLAGQDPMNIPLFQLAALTPAEKRVNFQKLQAFLMKNGEFPARYRPLIWRFLLKLPENTEAFADLGKTLSRTKLLVLALKRLSF